MSRDYRFPIVMTAFFFLLSVSGCSIMAAGDSEPKDLVIIDRWGGDFPVAELDLLPEGQRQSRAGYIDDQEIFATLWRAFKPGEKVPAVDFDRNLVVFSRNLDFYNRAQIFKVTLSGGDLEILAMETMSAMPIEDNVAMALAVVPRAGVGFVVSGDVRIPVTDSR